MTKVSIFNNYMRMLELSEKMSNGLPMEHIDYIFYVTFNPYEENVKEYIEKLYSLNIIKNEFDNLLSQIGSFEDGGKYIFPSSIGCKIDNRGRIKGGTESNEPYRKYNNVLKSLNKKLIKNNLICTLGEGINSCSSNIIKEYFVTFFDLLRKDKKDISGPSLFISEGDGGDVNSLGMKNKVLKQESNKNRAKIKKENKKWKERIRKERERKENMSSKRGIFSYLFR